jgi:murein DD-endopeptidase MepM/ murein hydrolase activator NlpD
MERPARSGAWGVPWLGLPLGGVLALAVAAQFAWDATLFQPTEIERTLVAPDRATIAASLSLEAAPVPRVAARSAALRSGQTLGGLLIDLGLTAEEAHAAATASKRYVDVRQLRAGTPWAIYRDEEGVLDRFELTVEGRGELALERSPLGWQPAWREYERETRVRAVRGELVGSLEASMSRAGAPVELAYAVADVLQWDLDFTRDLRRGDTFRVLFEETVVEGYEPKPSRVLAVHYGRAGGRALEAYLFGSGESAGYFDAEGRPLQKLFLRSPLPYSRVTSRFSHSRFHPVLKSFRPHYGVDYGAPVGTPVRVTASGTVVSAGWDGGGGRTVKVRHPNGYLTAYLHLSGFASGVRSGAMVRQGQVVGYVGATGLATGPHLDYRVQQNGRWIDPLSIKSVPAEPVSPLRKPEFEAVRLAMRSSLETGRAFEPPAVVAARSTTQVAAAGGALPGTRGF